MNKKTVILLILAIAVTSVLANGIALYSTGKSIPEMIAEWLHLIFG